MHACHNCMSHNVYSYHLFTGGKQAKKNYKTLTAIRKEGVDLCGEDWEAYRDLAMIEPICQTFLRQAKQARSKRTNSGRSKTRNNIISDSTVITKRGGRSSNKRTRGSHEGKKKSKVYTQIYKCEINRTY